MSNLFSHLKNFSLIFYSCLVLIFVLLLSDWQKLKLSLVSTDILEENTEFHTSVYCRGHNHTDRICKFKNLCYNPVVNNFIFFHDIKSDIIGVPEDRFSPALVDFSSVYDHNTQYFNFIDVPSSVFSSFRVKYINGVAISFKRFNPENLMHVFHDDLIPAFVTLEENFLLDEDLDVYFAFADGREPGPYAELYEKFLINKPIYLNMMSQTICFEKAIVGLNKHSLWYQYGFKQPQGPINKDLNLISTTLIKFRRYFIKRFSLHQNKSNKSIALVMTRGHNRKILNSRELAKTIEKNSNLKTDIVSLEKFSVIDVIKKIMSCNLIVGMHGSLLILSLFLPPYSRVIELFPYGINPNICTPYKTLSSIPGLKLTYHSWENKIKENSVPHPEFPADLGGILHLPVDVQEKIKNSIVKPFLCCYNPEWLYRIYQDTIVDLDSISTMVKNAFDITQTSVENRNYEMRLFPSEVQNIDCRLTSQNFYNVSWEKPWNVDFMNATNVEYELWYQDINEDEIKAFIMHKTFFPLPQNKLNLYVWIRCHVDGKIGPFNTDPFICLK